MDVKDLVEEDTACAYLPYQESAGKAVSVLKPCVDEDWKRRNFSIGDRKNFFLPLLLRAIPNTSIKYYTLSGQEHTEFFGADSQLAIVIPVDPDNYIFRVDINVYHPQDVAQEGNRKVSIYCSTLPVESSAKKQYSIQHQIPNDQMYIGQTATLKVTQNGVDVPRSSDIKFFMPPDDSIKISDTDYTITAVLDSAAVFPVIVYKEAEIQDRIFGYTKLWAGK